MRRFAFFLAFLAALAVVGSYALELAAPSLAAGALRAAGLEAQELAVEVDASPPLWLLVGRVDRLRISASHFRDRSFSGRSLVAEMAPVDLLDLSRTAISGQVTGAVLGPLPLGQVTLSGHLPEVAVAATIPAPEVRALVATAAGVAASQIGLAAPDGLVLAVAGHTVRGTLRVSPDGRALLVANPSLAAPLTVVQLAADDPVRLVGVTVGAGGLELRGTLRLAWP